MAVGDKRAIQSTAKGMKDGSIVVINSDVVYPSDHEYVKRWPEVFVDADKHPEIIHG